MFGVGAEVGLEEFCEEEDAVGFGGGEDGGFFGLSDHLNLKLCIVILFDMSEVEETLNRMQTHKNVQGIVIVNSEGAIIRSTYTNERKE